MSSSEAAARLSRHRAEIVEAEIVAAGGTSSEAAELADALDQAVAALSASATAERAERAAAYLYERTMRAERGIEDASWPPPADLAEGWREMARDLLERIEAPAD